jgi:hypothetical protein
MALKANQNTPRQHANNCLYSQAYGTKCTCGVGEFPPEDVAAPLEPSTVPQICIDCGHEFGVWFAENPVWNEIIPGRVGMLCPCCFIVRAEKHGFKTTGWKMVPMDNPLGEKSVEQLGDTRELKAALQRLAEILCEERGHTGRRPCEFCRMQSGLGLCVAQP